MEKQLQDVTAENPKSKKTQYRLWLIPFVVCFMNLISGGSERSNSLIFVAIMEEGNFGRLVASLPTTARAAATIVLAGVTGLLGIRLSFLALGSLGLFLYVSGRVVCYFSTNVYTITIFYGFISGGGNMLLWTHLPTIINTTLKENRSTAMGIATLGIPLGGFFWPYITQFLLDNYDLRGTFLLTAGISLHGFLGVFIISAITHNKNFMKNRMDDAQKDELNKKRLTKVKSEDRGLSRADKLKPVTSYDHDNSKTHLKNENLSKSEISGTAPETSETESENECECESKTANDISGKRILLRVLRTRAFYMLSFTTAVNFYSQASVNQVLVDFLADKGILRPSALVMITVFSSGGIVGRLLFGWITDRKIISSRVMTSINLSVCATAIIITTLFDHYYVLWTCYLVLGICQASNMVTNWVQYSHYFNEYEMMMAMSASRFIFGFSQLSRTPVIGLCRDFLKTYDYFFRGLALLLYIFAGMWLYEEHLVKRRNQKYQKLSTEDPDGV